jgi:thioesterase domain-containing protein
VSALAAGVRASRDVLVRNPPRDGLVSRPDFHFFHGDLRGGGFYCLTLAGHVGRDQPFYALSPPGHAGGPIAPDFESLVVHQLALLREVRPRGPYRLGGYCNGALVAYEIARRLVAAGERVERVVLLAPGIPLAGGWLGDIVRRADMRREYYVEYYTERTRAFRSLSIGGQLRYLGAKARSMAGLGQSAALNLPRVGPPPKPVREIDLRNREFFGNIRSYLPGPYDGLVDVLWPMEERRWRRRYSMRVWRRVTRRLRVRAVPGNHNTCVVGEGVGALGAAIRACLDDEEIPPRR